MLRSLRVAVERSSLSLSTNTHQDRDASESPRRPGSTTTLSLSYTCSVYLYTDICTYLDTQLPDINTSCSAQCFRLISSSVVSLPPPLPLFLLPFSNLFTLLIFSCPFSLTPLSSSPCPLHPVILHLSSSLPLLPLQLGRCSDSDSEHRGVL